MLGKTKSIPYKRYVELIRPQYIYLKIITEKSIRNYNSSNIAKAITYTYKSLAKRIKKEQKKIWIETDYKISYVVDIKKDDVAFYFIVPNCFKSLIIDKMREIWHKATIEETERIEGYSEDVIAYELNYKKEDALSLAIDKKSNEPLNSILSVTDIMKDNDRVTIIYNFLPTPQTGWKERYKETMSKYKKHKPLDKKKFTTSYLLRSGLTGMLCLVDTVIEVLSEFLGSNADKKESLAESISTMLIEDRALSKNTKNKKETTILETEVVVISESDDKTRKENNAISVCQSYNSIEEDNELIYSPLKVKKSFNIEDYRLTQNRNTFSVDECHNFIQIPGRELVEKYKIQHIDTRENNVPTELQIGDKFIGHVTCRGNTEKLHLTNDKDYKNLAVAIIGPTRSGKSSLLGNMARDSINAGECVIVPDYIENCLLSDEIKACIPTDKVLELNLYDYKNNLQGLGYNEAIKDSADPFLIYESAKQQASQVATLINSVNVASSEFTPKMERFLNSACLLAFVRKGAVRDVINILQDHVTRHTFINNVPKNLSEYLEEYINYLKELDEYNKEGEIVGSKINNIVGILDRVNRLKSNTYMEFMLKKGIEDNFNLYEEMQKNQCIFIKMPESMFNTAEERDTMVTYWLTKIWLAGQVRAWNIRDRYQRKTVTVITDEIAQLKNAEEFIGNKLDQTAKFGIKFLISTMYINQLRIKEKLRTANTSYIFISGADKNNFKEMKEEFEEKGFELEDMQKLKRFHSLNYLKFEGGYWAGISNLPKPIEG